MNAIIIEKHGGAEVLQYKEVADPQPGDHEVVIENQAIGVNYIDIYHRTGLYKKDLPFVPGLEGSGIVVKVGKKVYQWKEGDHVAYNNVPGAYASLVKAPEDKVVQLPNNITHEQAAAIMLQGLTAHYLSRSTYPLKEGDTCLILAAAGGVGLILTQMAKMCGAYVIGAVSTKDKAELAYKAGADAVILYSEQDFVEEVKRITNGKGVNVVYDSVGKATFDQSLNCLMPLGYMVLFGQSSGPVPPVDPTILNVKGSLFLTRPTLFHYISNSQKLKARADDVFCWVIENKISVRIDRTVPLKDAAKAHQALENRETSGKILLVPHG
jgi:NADPH:quinone reductase